MTPDLGSILAPRTVDELPAFEPDPTSSVADHLSAVDSIRERSWVARSSRGLEIISYAGVEAAFRNDDLLPGVQKALVHMGLDKDELVGSSGGSMLLSEGENHLRLHRVVSRWFTPRRIELIRERVAELVGELAAPLTEQGGGDFMDGLARRLPGPVFCWMIGADPALGDRLFAISEIVLRAFTGDPAVADEVTAAAGDMRALVEEVISAKRGHPGDDLMTIMLDAVESGTLTIEDVHTLAFEMLSASTDNTANSAGLALMMLSRNPDQWDLLHRDPEGVAPTAVEECMRVYPRVRYGRGWNPRPTTLLGLEIPPDTATWFDIIAAHHDPGVFPDPHRFDVTREHARPQLNFGTGRHYCLGSALARMELQVVFTKLGAAWSEVTPAGEPETHTSGIDNAVRHLPIVVSVA